MEKKDIKAQAEAYCSQDKSYRRSAEGQAELAALPAPVQAKVREILEGRRGFRRVNGEIELTQDALVAEIARLKEKRVDTEAKLPLLDAKIAEKEEELAERFGEDNE